MRKSLEQATALKLLLQNNTLSSAETISLQELILESANRGWQKEHLAPLVEALATSSPTRRKEQKWVDSILNIFTEAEWERWRAQGLAGMTETLQEIFSRLMSSSGKNICEYTKKQVTAIWLHLRGDAVAVGQQRSWDIAH